MTISVKTPRRVKKIIEFPTSRKQVIEWCVKKSVNFEDCKRPTRTTPKSWEWVRAGLDIWYLVRMHPATNLCNDNDVVSEVDVIDFLNKKNQTICDVYDVAKAATIHHLNNRNSKYDNNH